MADTTRAETTPVLPFSWLADKNSPVWPILNSRERGLKTPHSSRHTIKRIRTRLVCQRGAGPAIRTKIYNKGIFGNQGGQQGFSNQLARTQRTGTIAPEQVERDFCA